MRAYQQKLFLVATVAAGLFGALPRAQAYSFVPTDMEWAAWPEYCRARYVTVQVGEASKWHREYTRAQIEASRHMIGPDTFVHIHHYCAGLAYLGRARTESIPAVRDPILQSANAEMTYTFTRIPHSSPLYSTVAYNLSQVHKAMGRTDDAIATVQRAIDAAPTDARGYIALALLYRDLKKLTLAREILEKGNEVSGDQSPELHYNLGLISFELRDYDAAQVYAAKAYEKGYPLPGLKQMLSKVGRSL